jgi:CBS domain-containing protein
MMHTTTARDLLARKSKGVVAVSPRASVLEAAKLMGKHGYGCVLVLDEGRLVGIFTERDVLRRVVAVGVDPATTPVADVMTTGLFTCLPDTSVAEVGAIMTQHRIRHLPVVDEAGLHGLVSIGDVLAFRVAEQEDTIRFLNEYMFNAR